MKHESVLLKESIEALNIKKKGIYVDGTLGGGGHSAKIAEALEGTGQLIVIDQDPYAIGRGKERLKAYNNITFVENNFSNIAIILENLNIEKIDGFLMDLGVSSFQLDDGQRGFSYHKDAALDMRMNPNIAVTAARIINSYSKEDLAQIFRLYGEEPFAWQIAKNIEKKRSIKPIENTLELVEIIKESMTEKEKKKKGHPGKRVFQALRIEVNRELSALEKALEDSEKYLSIGGRLVVITFHSLEDRIVKHFIKDKEKPCKCPPDFPVCTCGKVSTLRNVTRKVILPAEDELVRNNRARSAKLRVAEKI
ncbi:16S rRNA (cytosine(1402)-N(4))-methyltransferase [endosymbiont 'TC1' of Trimyema compressum]|uniref:16S rRNA (cytosine(1402)-N(4))-methyltransferase RsmH n=1 Tax=endosymbiont 'TC1' of Trimyema compressum TaxID=243899 RepID=UPI0007F1126B|nr:16S rRNA (cytosine(1402)-N(4))-methyltransferase RsmH [endosymbiont 'TC1' of Trimyema compressum]AMP20165.1 16S rRNA (cytosine(1402)-N(4))-methyltransferase [endosymbiont 'TC1' of Trimyema compressum]